MPVAAREIGVAGREPVDEAIFKQKVECAVDRDRRWALTRCLGDLVDHLVRAEGAAFVGENLKDTPPAGRKADPISAAACNRSLDCALAGVVLSCFGPRLRECFGGSNHNAIPYHNQMGKATIGALPPV